jgi:hypothetical protein
MKLVISEGKLVGGLVYGRPRDIAPAIAAVRRSQLVGDTLPALRDGRLDALAGDGGGSSLQASTSQPLAAAAS